mmetsp:Transcript_18363/g.56089  ORF Transcript_18363/g.56089 Transcript_18363/m.56089 type:complete len:1892 (-) Transcript_18363:292-5967(-)
MADITRANFIRAQYNLSSTTAAGDDPAKKLSKQQQRLKRHLQQAKLSSLEKGWVSEVWGGPLHDRSKKGAAAPGAGPGKLKKGKSMLSSTLPADLQLSRSDLMSPLAVARTFNNFQKTVGRRTLPKIQEKDLTEAGREAATSPSPARGKKRRTLAPEKSDYRTTVALSTYRNAVMEDKDKDDAQEVKKLLEETSKAKSVLYQTSQSESDREILRKLLWRERLLSDLKMLTETRVDLEVKGILNMLKEIRALTLWVTEAVVRWRSSQQNDGSGSAGGNDAPRVFSFRGRNVLVSFATDLDFLEAKAANSGLSDLPLSFEHNPFIVKESLLQGMPDNPMLDGKDEDLWTAVDDDNEDADEEGAGENHVKAFLKISRDMALRVRAAERSIIREAKANGLDVLAINEEREAERERAAMESAEAGEDDNPETLSPARGLKGVQLNLPAPEPPEPPMPVAGATGAPGTDAMATSLVEEDPDDVEALKGAKNDYVLQTLRRRLLKLRRESKDAMGRVHILEEELVALGEELVRMSTQKRMSERRYKSVVKLRKYAASERMRAAVIFWNQEVDALTLEVKARRSRLFFEHQELLRRNALAVTLHDEIHERKEQLAREREQRRLERKRKRDYGATALQSMFRGGRDREYIKLRRVAVAAVGEIIYEASEPFLARAREEYERRLVEEERQRIESATKLQAIARGRATRVEFEEQQRRRAEEEERRRRLAEELERKEAERRRVEEERRRQREEEERLAREEEERLAELARQREEEERLRLEAEEKDRLAREAEFKALQEEQLRLQEEERRAEELRRQTDQTNAALEKALTEERVRQEKEKQALRRQITLQEERLRDEQAKKASLEAMNKQMEADLERAYLSSAEAGELAQERAKLMAEIRERDEHVKAKNDTIARLEEEMQRKDEALRQEQEMLHKKEEEIKLAEAALRQRAQAAETEARAAELRRGREAELRRKKEEVLQQALDEDLAREQVEGEIAEEQAAVRLQALAQQQVSLEEFEAQKEAIIRIQSRTRGHIVRARTAETKKRRAQELAEAEAAAKKTAAEAAAAAAEAAAEADAALAAEEAAMTDEELAAIRLQASARGHISRVRSAERKKRHAKELAEAEAAAKKAADDAAAAAAAAAAEAEFAAAAEEAAVVRLHASARGHLAGKQDAAAVKAAVELEEVESVASARVQALARGPSARAEVEQTKAELQQSIRMSTIAVNGEIAVKAAQGPPDSESEDAPTTVPLSYLTQNQVGAWLAFHDVPDTTALLDRAGIHNGMDLYRLARAGIFTEELLANEGFDDQRMRQRLVGLVYEAYENRIALDEFLAVLDRSTGAAAQQGGLSLDVGHEVDAGTGLTADALRNHDTFNDIFEDLRREQFALSKRLAALQETLGDAGAADEIETPSSYRVGTGENIGEVLRLALAQQRELVHQAQHIEALARGNGAVRVKAIDTDSPTVKMTLGSALAAFTPKGSMVSVGSFINRPGSQAGTGAMAPIYAASSGLGSEIDDADLDAMMAGEARGLSLDVDAAQQMRPALHKSPLSFVAPGNAASYEMPEIYAESSHFGSEMGDDDRAGAQLRAMTAGATSSISFDFDDSPVPKDDDEPGSPGPGLFARAESGVEDMHSLHPSTSNDGSASAFSKGSASAFTKSPANTAASLGANPNRMPPIYAESSHASSNVRGDDDDDDHEEDDEAMVVPDYSRSNSMMEDGDGKKTPKEALLDPFASENQLKDIPVTVTYGDGKSLVSSLSDQSGNRGDSLMESHRAPTPEYIQESPSVKEARIQRVKKLQKAAMQELLDRAAKARRKAEQDEKDKIQRERELAFKFLRGYLQKRLEAQNFLHNAGQQALSDESSAHESIHRSRTEQAHRFLVNAATEASLKAPQRTPATPSP